MTDAEIIATAAERTAERLIQFCQWDKTINGVEVTPREAQLLSPGIIALQVFAAEIRTLIIANYPR